MRRRAVERPIDQHFQRGLDRVLSTDRPAGWEWGVAIAAIFLLGRSNVLFFRQRLNDVIGSRAGPIWQDDLLLQIVFGAVQLAVLVVACRRARPSALLRQPTLVAFVALAWLSIAWSIEPHTSVRRALLFAGTVAVGWYVGDRFSILDQIRIVVSVASLGIIGTLVALVFWPELATKTGTLSAWSGIYVNRNLFGSVLSFGLLAVFFLLRSKVVPNRWPLRVLGAVMFAFLLATESRTGPVALVCALLVVSCVWLFRRQAQRLSSAAGAYITFATLGTIGLAVNWYWIQILVWLGRDANLTKRTWIWQVDRWFSDQRPWTGWGFEALWTNPKAIEQAQHATGRYPFSAHSGYFEVVLGVGRVGLMLFLVFLVLAGWRAFRYAWRKTDAVSLWPLALIVFASVMNFSESMFVSSEALMALTVACAVGVTEWPRREAPQRPPDGRQQTLS